MVPAVGARADEPRREHRVDGHEVDTDPTHGAPSEWYSTIAHLVQAAHAQWRTLLLFASVGAAGGGVTALLLPSYYQSGAAFQAEPPALTQLPGALVGLASQVSTLPLGLQNGGQFFGDLLTTDAVLRRVASAQFPWHGASVPLPAVYGLDGKPQGVREFKTVAKLRKALKVDVSFRTGVVRFTIEARSPELAAALAESILAALNAANIELRRARAAAEQRFTAGRAEAARQELDSAEQALAAFYQRNRVISGSPTLQMEEAKLKRAVEMAQQLYVQLRLQEEQAAVQAVRNTPAISVIDPPLVPVKRSWPKAGQSLGLGGLFGVLIAIALVQRKRGPGGAGGP